MRWIMKMSAWSLACQQSVFQQDLSDKDLSEFYPQDGGESQLASKLRHCDPMFVVGICVVLWGCCTCPMWKKLIFKGHILWRDISEIHTAFDFQNRVGPNTRTHTHTCLTALCLGPPRWAGTRKVKPVWILLKQETLSGSGISWTMQVCTSLQTDNHSSTPPLKFFTGQMPFLPPNQQHQSTEGIGPNIDL